MGLIFLLSYFSGTILGNFKRRLRPLGRQNPRQEGLHYSPVADLGRPQAGAEEQRDPNSRIKDIIPQDLLTGKFCIFWTGNASWRYGGGFCGGIKEADWLFIIWVKRFVLMSTAPEEVEEPDPDYSESETFGRG